MQKIKQIIMFIVCSLFFVIGCTQNVSKKAAESFTFPTIPAILTTPEQRAEFVVTHYWDHFNFTDTTLISRSNYTEQAFVDFLNVLPNVTVVLAERGIDTLMSRSEVDTAMYRHFMALNEKYLYDPNSPFRNEELYIAVLRHIVANGKLSEMEKVRPQYQLNVALKNRVGQCATNFTYTTNQGERSELFAANGERILLFFFHPDCETCKAIKKYVEENGIDKLATIVWVNPDKDRYIDEIYDLRASPTLYLLDEKHTVLLKDASIEQIENYLKNK